MLTITEKITKIQISANHGHNYRYSNNIKNQRKNQRSTLYFIRRINKSTRLLQ